MKIRIKTTVHMPEVPGEVEIESGTLRDVLVKLLAGISVGSEIIDPSTGEMKLEGLFEVYLNNVSHNSLPEGLGACLRDGDTVTLSLILLGGG
jgi:hypothetical protein